MRAADKARLIEVLSNKKCGPCRRGDVNRGHHACLEAEELIRIVESEPDR